MDIARELLNPAAWQRFFEHKLSGGHLRPEEEKDLRKFISAEEYRAPVQNILEGGLFPPPKKSSISKMHSEKKRVVYTFPREENYTLKFLTFLLQEKYDSLFAPNLYSFRPGTGVRNAISAITKYPGIQKLYCYKADIHNYFNSIPVERLLPILSSALSPDPVILEFLSRLLTDPRVDDKGVITEEEKGIMAGCPISTFLANLYLSEMDWAFHRCHTLYARYSDDIILFSPSEEALNGKIDLVHRYLTAAGLEINPAKEQRSTPGTPWVFLGICYRNGIIDVAPASVEKLKAKMRRKTRSLMRWRAKKNTTGQNAAKAFIRAFRRKLFHNNSEHELTWIRWYFPLITTDASLKVIDQYAQQCIRYLVTGTHTKSSFNCRYQDMKDLGYVSLVNCYYNHIRFSENSEEPVD